MFSEVSLRPHDTGMVTLISQDVSEFALHVRGFLGLADGGIRQNGPAASAVILPELDSTNVQSGTLSVALGAGLQMRLGVALTTGHNIDDAVQRAVATQIKVSG